MYFLATSKIFAEQHAVVVTPYLRMPVLTQLNEMFFTLGLLFYDDIAAQLFQLLMLIMVTFAIIAFGQRYFSKQAGWWAAALWLANPIALWCGSAAYVDISLALFATMAEYAFWNWANSKNEHWLILSGTFCGFAAGTKYPGLFFVLVFGLLTLYIAFRTRKFSSLLRFGAPAFLTAGPWYLRNFYYTRNPVFPFLPQLFPSRYWSPEDVQGLVLNMRLYGSGHSLSSLLMLPWKITFNPDVFLSEGFYLPKAYLFGLPLLIVFAIRDLRLGKIVGYLAALMLFWFFSAQILRYLLPALPVLSIGIAASLDLLLRRIPFTKNWRSHWIFVAVIFGILAFGGWRYAVTVWQANGPIPMSQPEREHFLTARLPSFPAHKLLNGIRKSSYTLYAMQDENMAYFVDGTYKGDYFGPARYARIWDKLSKGQALYDELKSMEADYFLVNQARMKIKLPQDDFFQSHFKPMYERGNVQLFALTDSTFQSSLKNILKNPGFEQLANGRLEGWQVAGGPVVDSSGQNSFSGSVAVHCDRAGDVLYQVLPVDKDASYSFSCKAHAVETAGTGRLQINWSDANGSLIHQDLKVINLGSKWASYEVGIHSPENAVSATIYISPLDPSSVWFDDFSFGELEYTSLP